MPDFVHLHNHTHYSLLDATCLPQQLINAAVEDGQKAIALTDHGVMFGCFEFYKKAKEAKLKPILGFEAYVANGSRFDNSSGKAKTKKKNYFHLLLLAKNKTGYKNLIKLTTLAHTEGFYYKPRIDRELIEKYHEGIIAGSACIAGEISLNLIRNDYDAAFEAAKFYQSVFGDDYYIELQNHNLLEDEIVLSQAPKIAKELGIKLLATNDIHYLKSEHAYAHNVHLYIRDVTANNSGDVDIYKLRYRTPEMYFKTRETMCELFKDFPEALESTLEIADKCDLSLETKIFMPDFPIPPESKSKTLDEYLDELTYKGLNERYPNPSEEVLARAKYELDVIKTMKFPGYFLIVQDFINAARELGVSVGPGRGSAAGSIVAYALRITNVDPLPYDLLFERFLNPERISMPDIDIDFDDINRDKVIEYVKEKYGANSVSQIITFGKLSSRAVLTDVGRVLGVDLATIKRITSKIPVVQGKVTELKDVIKLPDLKWVNESTDPKIKELINFSLLLEGVIRNAGTHAAGIVIAPGDITDFVPLYSPPKLKSQSIDVATQYSMNELEDAGLLKMDFLGLRTLSIIDHTLEMIKDNYGIDLDIDKINFEDEKTLALLANGNTLAVFQFESQGMQEYLRQLKPKNLEELTAMNALYRPGPMENIPEFIDRKHGKKPISYLHPLMEKSLKNTYGIIVYQEQVMQLARDIAGFTLGEADILRRAMGKKKQKEMDKLKPQFLEGAAKNGIDNKLATVIYELIEKFAHYGFNKSHSLAYSYLAFQTAWLKANYPAEFLAANMTAELHNLDKIVLLIEEAKNFNINVLPPDVNRSFANFTVHEDSIIFGLAGIKNVGVSAVDSIIKARTEQPFNSFFDFVARTDNKLINKRALEALVCAGAFDSLNTYHRAALFESIEPALDYGRAFQDNANNQDDLFGGGTPTGLREPHIKDTPEWSEKARLDKEKEVLNFYLTGNPMDRFKPHLISLPTLSLGDKESKLLGQQCRICGLLSSIRTAYDRRQKQIAFGVLEDFSGRAEVIFWSDTYDKYKDLLTVDAVIMCIGKSELNGEGIKIIVEDVMTMEEAVKRFAKGYNIWIDLENADKEFIEGFHYKFRDNKSKNTVIFNVFNKSQKYRSRYVIYEYDVPVNNAIAIQIIDYFGRNNVRFLTD